MEKADFKLAGGLIGVLAAANEELVRNDLLMNFLGFFTIWIILLFTYRSFACGLYLLGPLICSNIIVNAYMAVNDIGVNIHTLPLVTVGVGFGIDYGLYIVSRIIEEIRVSGDLDDSVREALVTSGKAVTFTAVTMIDQHRVLDHLEHPLQRRDGPAARDLDGDQLRRLADAAAGADPDLQAEVHHARESAGDCDRGSRHGLRRDARGGTKLMEINFSNAGIFLIFFTIAFILMDEYIAKPMRRSRLERLAKTDPKVREALEIAARVAAREKAGKAD